MAFVKLGRGHGAKKQLFQRGLRRGFLTIQEIESSLPPGTMTAAERWLLYYSLRAAEIELRDETGNLVTVQPLSQEELSRLASERQQGEAPPAEQPAEALDSEEARQIEEALAAMEKGAADSQ